jgi:hypothetical protein
MSEVTKTVDVDVDVRTAYTSGHNLRSFPASWRE